VGWHFWKGPCRSLGKSLQRLRQITMALFGDFNKETMCTKLWRIVACLVISSILNVFFSAGRCSRELLLQSLIR
jgi:hypothetical protein